MGHGTLCICTYFVLPQTSVTSTYLQPKTMYVVLKTVLAHLIGPTSACGSTTVGRFPLVGYKHRIGTAQKPNNTQIQAERAMWPWNYPLSHRWTALGVSVPSLPGRRPPLSSAVSVLGCLTFSQRNGKLLPCEVTRRGVPRAAGPLIPPLV
jgi:hypothetical protein